MALGLKWLLPSDMEVPEFIRKSWKQTLIAWYKFRGEKVAANRKVVMELVEALGVMDSSHLEMLTFREKEEVITPQQSFVDYVGNYDVRRVNVKRFICDFGYWLNRDGVRLIEDMKENVNREKVEELWRKFLVFSMDDKEKDVEGFRFWIGLYLVERGFSLRRVKRVLLNATGRY